MRAMARVSVRGQIAIPKKIREILQIEEGDTIVFEVKDGDVKIRKIKSFLKNKGILKSKRSVRREER
jgi:AbrB family looped-hinge helix DNA binding protein